MDTMQCTGCKGAKKIMGLGGMPARNCLECEGHGVLYRNVHNDCSKVVVQSAAESLANSIDDLVVKNSLDDSLVLPLKNKRRGRPSKSGNLYARGQS